MIVQHPPDRVAETLVALDSRVQADGNLEGIVLLLGDFDQGREDLFCILSAGPGVDGEPVDARSQGAADFQVRRLFQ